MDILLNLPYTTFDDFYIAVTKIKHGWMHLNIGASGKRVSYVASYICDPLNDLLETTALMVKGEKPGTVYHGRAPASCGDYFEVTHDLESDYVTWLLKCVDEELTLIIWQTMPPDLADIGFNSELIYDLPPGGIPQLTADISFAMKGPLRTFIKALMHTFESLRGLKRYKSDCSDWGFSYPLDKLDFLRDWIAQNDGPINKSLK